jgi:hypothetical protein
MSREDKKTLYDIVEILALPDKDIRKGVERLEAKIRAGMTKEDIAWVEQQIAKLNR